MDNEINEALVGAEQLREMIMHSISLGSHSLISQAYQVKSRVKSSSSIKEKVATKTSRGRTDYTVKSIQDIVGIRLLTLFQQDLLSLVEKFVNYVDAFQAPPTDLFFGAELKDCIDEVIVYQSNTTEEIYESIYSFLKGFFVYRGFPEDFVKLDRKESKYSSVHFVVRGQVHLNSEIKVIPIEFQLRTVFEDVWGEVQHYLMYKNPYLDDADNREFRTEQGEKLLSILKASIDGCSEQAKLAYFTLRSENSSASLTQSKNAAKSNTASVLQGMESLLGDRSSGDVESLRTLIVTAYDDLHAGGISEDAEAVAHKFVSVLGEVERFDKIWSSYVPGDPVEQAKYRYLIDMERAAACYWIGQAVNERTLAESATWTSSYDQAVDYFERARQIYFELTALDSLANDPVLNFRIGQIYRTLSQTDLSILYYRSAYQGMKERGWTERGSVFAMLIPRHLAYIIWKEADELMRRHIGAEQFQAMSVEEKRRHPVGARYLSALKEALLISINIDRIEVEKDTPSVKSIEEEKVFAYNNGLWYGVEYVENGGTLEGISEGDGKISFDKSYYERHLEFSVYDDVEKIEISSLDTLIRAATFFKDDENGCRWLAEFRRRQATGDWDNLKVWQRARCEQTARQATENLNCPE